MRLQSIIAAAFSGISSGSAPFVPAFMQASAAGYQGAFPSVAGHTSVCMWRAATDRSEVEVIVSNAVFWGSGSTAEVFPSDGANLNIKAVLYVPTKPPSKPTRNFTGSLLAGATSGTLSANAPNSNWEYVEFSNGECRWVKYTSASTACSWDEPLSANVTNVARIWGFTKVGNFTFDGVTPGVLTGGQKSTLNGLIAADIKTGDPIIVQFYLSKVGGGNFQLPASQPADATDTIGVRLKEAYINSATDNSETMIGRAPWQALNQGVNQFRPVTLRGRGGSSGTYLEWTVLGDSNDAVTGSVVQRFMHANNIPFQNLAKAGEFGSSYLAMSSVRQQAYSGRGLLILLGENSATQAQMQAVIDHGRAKGFSKIIVGLLPPNTQVGSTGWSASDQSDQVANPNIRILNNWLISIVGQPGGIEDVLDINTPLVGVDIDKWLPNFTGDGIHLNVAARAAGFNYLQANNAQTKFLAPA